MTALPPRPSPAKKAFCMTALSCAVIAPARPALPCNLCQADDAEVLCPADVAQIARTVRCRKCGLIYTSPRPGVWDWTR